MNIRGPEQSPGCLSAIVLWLLLAAFSAYVAWQVYAAAMVLAAVWLQSPLPRPYGWSGESLVGISKLAVTLLAVLWIGFITYTEQALLRASNWAELAEWLTRWVIGLALLWGLALSAVALVG